MSQTNAEPTGTGLDRIQELIATPGVIEQGSLFCSNEARLAIEEDRRDFLSRIQEAIDSNPGRGRKPNLIGHLNHIHYMADSFREYEEWLSGSRRDAVNITRTLSPVGTNPPFYISKEAINNIKRFREKGISKQGQSNVENDQILANRSSEKELLILAGDTSSSPLLLTLLSKNENSEVRKHVAINPATPKRVLRELTKNYSTIIAVAGNINAPIDLLWELSDSPTIKISNKLRETLRRNPVTPCSLVNKLTSNGCTRLHPASLRFKALDPNTSSDRLLRLAGEEYTDIRTAVACHPNTDEFTIRKLAKDKEPAVRATIASNPKTPLDVQFELSQDEDPTVSEAIQPTSDSELIRKIYEAVREDNLLIPLILIGRDKDTPLDILIELSKHPNKKVRSEVAENNVPEEVLKRFALDYDEDPEIRCIAIENKNFTIQELKRLRRLHTDPDVCDSIQNRLEEDAQECTQE